MGENATHGGELKRGLQNRHIQLIALGGAIGTGLFYGSAPTIKMAGPAVLIAYAIGGFMAFLIMRQLGEMVANEPVAGSFSHFAYKYWGDFPGFLSGWNYWVLYVLVGMAELAAVGKYVHFWYPDMPMWVSGAVFFVVINAINLTAVKIYGEMEFWFAIVKVVAICGMIILGAYLLISGHAADQGATIKNLWQNGGFMPNGVKGIALCMAFVMFSFGGLELVGITAAEADNPKKTIPMAVNQVIYRILIFYIGALVVLLSLYSWDKVGTTGSPFVLIFENIGITGAANLLNIVVLTAALSVYNSCVYCNSRMLYALAEQGNAPKIFAKTNARGVPYQAIALSSAATLIGVFLTKIMPDRAVETLMSVVVAALIINWIMISLAHMKFREAWVRDGKDIFFKAFWFPFANYLLLAFDIGILVIMYNIGMETSVYAIPVWLVVIYIGYKVKVSTKKSSA